MYLLTNSKNTSCVIFKRDNLCFNPIDGIPFTWKLSKIFYHRMTVTWIAPLMITRFLLLLESRIRWTSSFYQLLQFLFNCIGLCFVVEAERHLRHDDVLLPTPYNLAEWSSNVDIIISINFAISITGLIVYQLFVGCFPNFKYLSFLIFSSYNRINRSNLFPVDCSSLLTSVITTFPNPFDQIFESNWPTIIQPF